MFWQVDAYAASRLPCTYAALKYVLNQVCARMRTRVQDAKLMRSSHPQLAVRVPALSPSSMLDFGSGPGTAALVAAAVWPQACSELVCVEPSPHMRSLADSLQAAVSARQPQASPPPCCFISALDRLRGPEQQRRYDLVIAAYSIGELPTRTARQQAIRRLWAHTRDVLVIVEPGTPKASTHVREARQDVLDLARRALRAQDKRAHTAVRNSLLSASADATPDDSSVHVVAPCAHEKRCPAEDTTATWCHFAQRVQRTTAQRVSKGVSNVWSHQVRASCVSSVRDVFRAHPSPCSVCADQDERFSYVILRRGPRPSPTSVVGHVQSSVSDDAVDDEEDAQAAGHPEPPEEDSLAGDASDEDEDSNSADDKTHVASAAAMELAVARAAAGWPRVMRPPRRRCRHVILDLCTPAGAFEQRTVAASHHRRLGPGTGDLVRRLRWGDAWPHP